MAWILISRPF